MATISASLSRYTVDIILLRALLQAAKFNRVSEKEILKHLGLSSTCLDLPSSRFPLEHLENAVNYVYRFVRREDFSPLVAKILTVEGLIFQVHISRHCNTLEEYSRLAPGFKRVYGDIGELNIAKAGGHLVLSWAPVEHTSAAATLFGDAFLCSSIFLARLFSVETLDDVKIELCHSKPLDERLIRSICGENITYSQPESSLRLTEASLRNPRINSSTDLEPNLLQTMDQLVDRGVVPDVFLRSVQTTVAQILPTGRCTITAVAESLHMSDRTLQRALDKRNTTFQSQLQTTRLMLAKKYLRENQITISQLAFLVGYMDQSSFSTAFKSWCGMAPSEFKKLQTKN